MISCEHPQSDLLDVAGRGDEPSGEIAAHMATCADCCEAWSDLAYATSALDALAPVPAPASVASPTRDLILGKLRHTRGPTVELALALAFGLLSAGLSLAMLGFRIDLGDRPTWAVASGAVAWAAMFVLAFWLMLHRRDGAGLPRLVGSGLAAAGVFLLADHLLPLTNVVQFCFRSSWARDHFGVLGLQGVYFVVGAGYALVPLFLLSVATGHRQGTALRSGLVAGGMFFFLLAPAIFIQCSAFTAGALIAWLGGAIVGSTVGGVAGYRLRRRAFSGG